MLRFGGHGSILNPAATQCEKVRPPRPWHKFAPAVAFPRMSGRACFTRPVHHKSIHPGEIVMPRLWRYKRDGQEFGR